MRVDAEADGPVWASKGDDRTRVGRILRKARIDEFRSSGTSCAAK